LYAMVPPPLRHARRAAGVRLPYPQYGGRGGGHQAGYYDIVKLRLKRRRR